MYRQIIVPSEEDHSIELPKYLFGKKVEVVVTEIDSPSDSDTPLPSDLKDKDFWNSIEFDPEFPSIEEIRSEAWPSRT